MDLVSNIADLSILRSQVELQVGLATRVFKVARDQSQSTASMMNEALENVEQMVEDFAGDVLSHVDVYA